MSFIGKLLLAATLGLILLGTPASAQDIRIEPIPPRVKPKWTQVPNVPGVFYAPNIPTDVFRHGTKYYFYWGGYLYHGDKAKGPWKVVKKVPDWFPQIDPSYFKTYKKGGPAAPPTGPAAAPEALGPAPPTAPPPAPEKAGPPQGAAAPPKVM
jgi:hypothetical protein